MNWFRYSDNWLRARTLKHIKQLHPKLFQPFRSRLIESFFDYLTDKNGFWLVLVIVVMFFLIGISGISNYLKLFSLSYDTAKSLIDSRAQNIATVISITLVVVGFILTNLAEKSSLVFALIFKRSYLYPIIYFALTGLAFIFVISTLRDSMSDENEELFIRMVVTATYISVFTLILIGVLFQSITTYTNADMIASMVHEAFMKEVRQTQINLLLKSHSKTIFREEMIKLNISKYDVYRQLELMNLNADVLETFTVDEESSDLPQEHLVQDVNLKMIGTFVSKKQRNPQKLFYKDIAINSVIMQTTDYITQDNLANTAEDKKVLSKALKKFRLQDREQGQRTVRIHLDKKFEQHVKNGDHVQLQIVLNSFREAYQFKMRYQ